jgi:hypothetical protein
MDTFCRAVTFSFSPHSMEWKELDPLLKKCWRMSTQLANWAMSELALADRLTVDRDAEKLGPMPDCYLYGLFSRAYPRKDDWRGAMAAANCILQAVRRKYLKDRLDVVWRGSKSLASFRYPYPFPVHNQNWSARYGQDNIPLVQAALPGGQVVLRLRGGPEMGRQLAGFRQIIDGAKRGELAIYRKGNHSMVKLVAHFPVQENEGATNAMNVCTDPHCLWMVEVNGLKAHPYNEDHVCWIAARHARHLAWLQRVSEDTKYEKRVPRQMRRHIDQARDDRCRKDADRLKTFCHEMTAQLVGFAERRKVGTVAYDDRDKSYMPMFPWHQLKTDLEYKLRVRNIVFLAKTEEESPDEPTIIN